MKLGIIGAGYIGRAVARLAVSRGHEVMISNSRHPRTLTSAMVSLRCNIGFAADAAQFGELTLLAVPFFAISDLDPAAFAGTTVMDACNYYPGRDQAVPTLDQETTTTSEIVQRHLADAKIVKAWNAILERDIEPDAKPAGTPGRRALPIAGDDEDAKQRVTAFFDDLGFDIIDAGPLAQGWRFERAQPAYCVTLDRAGLQAALVRAGNRVAEGSWRAPSGQIP